MRKKILSPRIYPSHLSLESTWFVQYWTQEEKPRRLKIVVPNLSTQEARLKAANDIIAEIQNKKGYKKKIDIEGCNAQLKFLFDYIESIKANHRKGTYFAYRMCVRNLDTYCKKYKVRQITNEVAQNFISELHAKPLSAVTVNFNRETLSGLFNALRKTKKIRSNPFQGIEKLREHTEGSTYYRQNQINELKKIFAEKKPFLLPIIEYLFYTFIRPGELRQLRVQDIDFDNGKINVKGSISKNLKNEYVIIPKQFLQVLKSRGVHQAPPQYFLLGHDGEPSEIQVGKNYFSRHHLEILKDLNYDSRCNLYTWVHTGVCHAYRNGIGIREIQLQKRHHSLDMTEYYLRGLGLMEFDNLKDKFPTL